MATSRILRFVRTFCTVAIFAAAVLGLYMERTQAPGNPPTVPATSPATATAPRIASLLVPFNDPDTAKRAAFFKKASREAGSPKTVILVMPDHSPHGAPFTTSDRRMPSIPTDTAIVSTLLGSGAANRPDALETEAVTSLITGIKDTFPTALLTPVLVNDSVSLDGIQGFSRALRATCPSCLLIAASNLSQSRVALLRDLHDNLTLRALTTLDSTRLLHDAETESPPVLALLAEWSQSQKGNRFALYARPSAPSLQDALASPVYGWFERSNRSVSAPSVSFIFGGDVMLDRMVNHAFPGDKLLTVFDNLGEGFFHGTDGAVVNLEGPVSDTPITDDISSNNLTFNFPPKTIDTLTKAKITSVSLGNNHTDNAGKSGLATTLGLLETAKIQTIGGPGIADIARVGTIRGDGLDISIIAANIVFRDIDLVPLVRQEAAKPNTKVIVFPHWGVEYQAVHSNHQAELARAWIEAGADAVIGSHPHVVQDVGEYQGKPIVYSLGNLVFDQTFSQETQQGLFVAGEFTDTDLSLFILPVQAKNLRPTLNDGTSKTELLQGLYQPVKARLQDGDLSKRLVFPYSP